MTIQVEFYTKPKQNDLKSAEAGRPIFDEVEMVRVITEDRNFEPHFPAHEPAITYDQRRRTDDTRTWAERYAGEYKAFKQRHVPSESGTPIEQWPVLSRAKVSELRALDISTVEQIAAMSERDQHRLGTEGRSLVSQANLYIQSAREAAPANQMAAENARLKEEVERLRKEKMERVAEEHAEGEKHASEDDDDEKPRRGRPRKLA